MEECDKEEKIFVYPPYTFEPPYILRREGKIVKNVWQDGGKPTQEEVNKFIRSFPRHPASGKGI